MRKSLVTEVHPAKGQAGPLTLFGLTTDPMRTKLKGNDGAGAGGEATYARRQGMTERESLIWAYRQLQAVGALTSSEEGRQVGQRLMQMADRMAQVWPAGVPVGGEGQQEKVR